MTRLAKRHGGMRAGAENGKRGYQLTFGIAYIRDFIMKHYILGESFETSVPWSQALALCENVKRRLARGVRGARLAGHAVRHLPHHPGVRDRRLHLLLLRLLPQGRGASRRRSTRSSSTRRATRSCESGGSLSHHHGIGKIRREYLPRVFSPATLEWAAEMKRAVDPTNVFGIANQ